MASQDVLSHSNILLPPQIKHDPLLEDSNSLDAKSKKRKKRYKRVKKACVYCSRSHMSCEDARPCKRCVDRGISELCTDNVTEKRRGRRATYLESSSSDSEQQSKSYVKQELPPPSTPSPAPLSSPIQVNSPPPQQQSPQIYVQKHSTTTTTTQQYSVQEYHQPVMHFKEQQMLQTDNLPLDFQMLADMLYYNFDGGVFHNVKAVRTPLHFEEPQDEAKFWKFMDSMKQQLMHGCTSDEADGVIASVCGLRRLIQTTLVSHFNGPIPASLPRYWQMERFSNELTSFVEEQKKFFEFHGTPTILWDRSGSIHFVNNAYKRLTSWNLPLPTSREDFHFHNELSPYGFKEFVVNCISIIAAQFPHRTDVNWFMFNTGVRIHSVVNKFIEGTMSITFKQDMLGFPLLYVGNFLPRTVTSTPLPQF